MPNLTNMRLNELERAEKQLREIQKRSAMKPFMKRFRKNVMMMLAYYPMSEWPHFCTAAFESAERDLPNGAGLYREAKKK